ncbi:FadD3 family acyl-CoA ligase [Aromatoleum anaerobium]|uniref:AMP-binding protein n=1 Tax=Aromatoleum anaerobium TaxID=182180 RepID=A0ABX1PKR3_9RHOO|nr:FadD3 family acyl-CoA ligase [Aromatoleum anaerobium]MCK0508110.1 FadD3 family acyl-CoA ligase [Aromatoleum anaerobium]
MQVQQNAVTIPALVFDAAQRHSGRIAIEEDGQRIGYAELPGLALAVSRALLAHGIEAGDRVAIWAPNGVEWILAALGVHCAGAVMVPINTRMKGTEAADILARSRTRLLFVVGEFLGVDYLAMLAPHRPATLERVVVLSGPKPPRAGDLDWDTFLATGAAVAEAAARARANAVRPDDLSDLMFTSGTTGKPKGVMSAHGQCVRAFSEYVRVIGLVAGDRYLIVNPFFHAFGYKAGWLTCLIAGATILPHPVFDAEAVFRRIEADRITVLPGPPTLYLSMLAHPRLAESDLSSLRIAVTGAATIPPVLIERMRRELGFEVVTTAYGLTECGGLATICDPSDDAETVASTSGRAIPGTKVRIIDADNRPLPAGEAGEICLRGFHVMKGYFEDPKATAETIDADGWLHTGDVGTLDAHGYLRITDRLKDMFIVGGFNCYPAEIEAALTEHPAIAQVAVIGVPDERMGEVGCACVVLRPGQRLDEPGLIAWSRERMANYKVPRFVRFFGALPVNASNKVMKNELRAMSVG